MKKVLSTVTLIMALIMIIPTNVFASENDNGIMLTEYDGNENFNQNFTLYDTLWGIRHEIHMNVYFEISYEYEEDSWSRIKDYTIHINSLDIDGNGVSYSVEDTYLGMSAVYKIVKINDSQLVKIGMSVDNYGDVNVYAQLI